MTTFNGFDIMASDDPLFIGRIGTLGTRAGNFALQNADVVLEIGTRNNIRQISYNWDSFAKEAFKVIVDVDAAELQKPTVKPDMAVNCDAAVFIHELQRGFNALAVIDRQKWLRWCIKRKLNYDVVLPDYAKVKKFIQPYYFARTLTRILDRDDVVVAGNGTACITLFQAGIVKKGQKIFWNSGCASMGYDLPAAIGACFSGKGKRVICLAGDGSLQMNIQEFQTIVHHKLPLKLFVLNNQGYVSIQQTQDAFFDGNRVACCPKTGVSFPDIVAVAKAYGLRALRLHSHKGLERTITMFLAEKGPGVCEIVLTPGYIFSPKTSSKKLSDGRIVSSSLDDMYPFLERKEFLSNKIQGNIG